MTEIKYGKLNFVITGAPNTNNINEFISTIQKYKVSYVIRICEKTYDDNEVIKYAKIKEYGIEDGKFPGNDIINNWLELLYENFYKLYNSTSILLHCKAGLGRAPLLVCIAIIICENLDAHDAIEYIRKYIKCALNTVQINYLLNTNFKIYQKRFKKLVQQSNCLIM